MIGLILGLVGAAIAGITGVIGSIMQSNTASEQIEASQQIAQQQMEVAREGHETDLQINQQNIEMQKEINEANIQNQNEQNAIMRAREDNAVQRRMLDLQAAGINPLLAGVQGASAQGGHLALQQAPIADTSIGSRYAQNITNILSSLMQNEATGREMKARGLSEINTVFSNTLTNITQITKNREEARLIEQQVNESRGRTKKLLEETIKTQKEVDKITEDIAQSKTQRAYIQEMITSEPIKRAMVKAETEEQYEKIKEYQQKIINMKEERTTEIIRQSKIIEEINISKETLTKIRAEVVNLILDGDMKKFENSMKELDKVTDTTKAYIDMFVSIFKSIW